MVQTPKLPMDHIVAAFQLSPNDETGTVAPASRVVSSHMRGLVKCVGGPQAPRYRLLESLVGGASGLITPRRSSNPLGRRPGGSLGECFWIRVQEIPQLSKVFWNSAVAM